MRFCVIPASDANLKMKGAPPPMFT